MSLKRLVLVVLLASLAQCGPIRIGRDAAGYSANAASSPGNVGAVGGAEPAALRSGAPDFACAAGAVTCVRINGRNAGGGVLPATFGMPFAPGQLPAGGSLRATVGGAAVPMQVDQRSSYADGSARLAILSLALPASRAGEVVSFLPGAGPGGPPVDPTAWLAGHDTRMLVNLYSPQISTITLGNRRGHDAGTPFQVGEVVTVHLGDDSPETYSVTVTDKTAGGAFGSLTGISKELATAIDRSSRFHAYKLGEGGGYETLWVTTRGGAGASRPFAVRVETNSQAPVRSQILQPAEPPRRYSASARSMLASGKRATWLSGPAAGEVLLSGPLVGEDGSAHPRLTARMNVRTYAGVPAARTDVVLEDLWAYEPGTRNWHYDVAIEQDGKAMFRADDVTHFHNARWHKVVWSGGAEPDLFVQYDRHHFINSHAVQHYDERLVVPSSVVQADFANLARIDTGIMGNANVLYYFGTTGGRPDIGPLPRWSTIYLLTMDPREYAVMMANADASGSIPIHLRDRATDRPVDADAHAGAEKAAPVMNGDTPWSPEPAHQPSLTYLPYIVTGDHYYLEETQFWAAWNLSLQHGPVGVVLGSLQTRGDAWSLRSVAEAAEVTPDADPSKRYFDGKLATNLRYAGDLYAKRSNPLGLDSIFNHGTRYAPWQADFLILTLSQINANQYAGAETFMRWLAVPTMGVWTNEQNGYCRNNAPAPGLTMTRPNNGGLVTTWKELHTVNFPDQVTCPANFPGSAYERSPLGYVANAMAAAAVLSDINYPDARSIFDLLNEHDRNVDFGRDPTWRIVPR